LQQSNNAQNAGLLVFRSPLVSAVKVRSPLGGRT
jgi:hypothetical protein